MKMSKKLLATAVASSALLQGAFAPVANAEAEVSASVAIASSYHWRGFDLGSGTPAVSGDIGVSASGFYAGMWVSSGDTAAGTEYDIFFGYGGEVGDFSYDISYVSYVYPTGAFSQTDGSIGDFAEIILGLGFGPVSVFYHDNVAGDTGGYAFTEDYFYYGASVDFGSGFSATIAKHDEEDVEDGAPGVTGNATHLDLGYAYNDNLSFTFSAILDSEFDSDGEPEPKFVVSYSLPIGE